VLVDNRTGVELVNEPELSLCVPEDSTRLDVVDCNVVCEVVFDDSFAVDGDDITEANGGVDRTPVGRISGKVMLVGSPG
jgi:hypothetical protein